MASFFKNKQIKKTLIHQAMY